MNKHAQLSETEPVSISDKKNYYLTAKVVCVDFMRRRTKSLMRPETKM